MNLQQIKDKFIKSELAQELYNILKELRDNDNFATGVVVNCETDENIKKMLNFIKNKKPLPKDILLYSVELDKNSSKSFGSDMNTFYDSDEEEKLA